MVRPSNKDYKHVPSNYVPLDYGQTNRFFAESNKEFRDACALAKVEPSKEHARRWKSKIGKVWHAAQKAADEKFKNESVAA